MKTLFIALLVLLSLSCSGQELREDKSKSCSFQSRELALRVQQDIFPDMSQEQRSRLMALGVKICMEHANHTFTQVADKTQSDEAGKEEKTEEESSWFSDIFDGELKGGKKGNERLRK